MLKLEKTFKKTEKSKKYGLTEDKNLFEIVKPFKPLKYNGF